MVGRLQAALVRQIVGACVIGRQRLVRALPDAPPICTFGVVPAMETVLTLQLKVQFIAQFKVQFKAQFKVQFKAQFNVQFKAQFKV